MAILRENYMKMYEKKKDLKTKKLPTYVLR